MTELYSYWQTSNNPYAFAHKYRLENIKEISIHTELKLSKLLKASNSVSFSSMKINDLECELRIQRPNSPLIYEVIFVDVEISSEGIELSIEGNSVENYLMVNNFVETTKY